MSWVHRARAQHVQRHIDLVHQQVPGICREVSVNSVDNGNEVALEGLHGPFCRIPLVICLGHGFVIQFFCLNSLNWRFRGLIVDPMEDWLEPAFHQHLTCLITRSDQFRGLLRFDGNTVDAAGVWITENEHALVSTV